MTLHVDIPGSRARQVTDLAAKQQVTANQVVAAALTAQASAAGTRPSIVERTQRVDWQKVDEVLSRASAAAGRRTLSVVHCCKLAASRLLNPFLTHRCSKIAKTIFQCPRPGKVYRLPSEKHLWVTPEVARRLSIVELNPMQPSATVPRNADANDSR